MGDVVVRVGSGHTALLLLEVVGSGQVNGAMPRTNMTTWSVHSYSIYKDPRNSSYHCGLCPTFYYILHSLTVYRDTL